MALNLTKGIFLGPVAEPDAEGIGTRSNVLRSNPLLRSLTAEELSTLIAEGQWLRFTPGKAITREGMPAEHVWFLVEGRVKAEISGLDGHAFSAAVDFFGPGDGIGLLSLVDGAPYAVAHMALEDVLAVAIPTESVRSVLVGHPEWYRVLAEMAVSRIRAGSFWLPASA